MLRVLPLREEVVVVNSLGGDQAGMVEQPLEVLVLRGVEHGRHRLLRFAAVAVEDHDGHDLGEVRMPHRHSHRRVEHLHHHFAPAVRLQLLVQHLISRQILPVSVPSCPRQPGDALALDVADVLSDLEERVQHSLNVASLSKLDGVDVVLPRVAHHELPLHSDPFLFRHDPSRANPNLSESKPRAITNILQQRLQRPCILCLLAFGLLLEVSWRGSLQSLGTSCPDLLHDAMSRLLQLG
mmetsp:Transcript_9805/g.32810  ORF Transcript_9805/g.32810 Transcript_9805/m.32810 type:complete len:239 (-) Transcript_9805:131-847(-)